MRKARITNAMYERIPELLAQGMTRNDIAALYGVKPGTLSVFCSYRRISLRSPHGAKGNSTVLDEPLTLSNCTIRSLRIAASTFGKGSAAQLISELLEKIASDDLYRAVLDEPDQQEEGNALVCEEQ